MDYFQADEIQDKSYDSTLMRRILTYLKPYRTLVVVSILLLAFVALGCLVMLVRKCRLDAARHRGNHGGNHIQCMGLRHHLLRDLASGSHHHRDRR